MIPQLLRASRLNPEQLKDVYVTGPAGRLVALGSIARIRDSVAPRALPRFQQLNAVKLSGVAIRPLDEALRFVEGKAARILPKGYTLDYTGESRQLQPREILRWLRESTGLYLERGMPRTSRVWSVVLRTGDRRLPAEDGEGPMGDSRALGPLGRRGFPIRAARLVSSPVASSRQRSPNP